MTTILDMAEEMIGKLREDIETSWRASHEDEQQVDHHNRESGKKC